MKIHQLRHVAEVSEEVANELEERLKNPELYLPIPTHLEKLDELLQGGLPNQVYKLIVGIGGKWKMGKTALAAQLSVLRAAQTKEKTGFFALEELNEQTILRIFTRHITSLVRTSFYTMRYGMRDIEAIRILISQLREIEFYVTDTVYSPVEIVKMALENELDLVVVDNMNLTEMPGRTEAERLDNAMKIFIEARNTHHINFIIVFQLNDDGQAFGSRTVYRGSDLVLQIQPVKDYVSGKVLEGLAKIETLRSRRSKPGEAELGFNGDGSRFFNVIELDLNSQDFLDFMLPEQEPDEEIQEGVQL